MSVDETVRLDAVAAWLEPRLQNAAGLTLALGGTPGSGFSAETTILLAEWREGDEPRSDRFVLRRETPDPAVYPAQAPGLQVEVDLQYRIMRAVAAASDLPLAPLLGYESDPAVLGSPFFVMGFIDGVVPIENPMYTLEGFFTEISPEQRRSMITDGIRMLAAVHTIDWRAAGLNWLVPTGEEPTTERQLGIWQRYAADALRGREHPLLDRAFAWLRTNLPAGSSAALCWGDPRPGNIIWKDHRAACVTDWEAAYIGAPELDLGWWLMFDRWAHEASGITERAEGDLTREEQVALYEQFTGRSVGATGWYEVFAAARYAAIVVQVMNRWVDRGDLPADHTLWIDNPVVPCLASLMAEIE